MASPDIEKTKIGDEDRVGTKIFVINLPDSLVSETNAGLMVIACNILLEKAAKLWGRTFIPVSLIKQEDAADITSKHNDCFVLYLADQPNESAKSAKKYNTKYIYSYPIISAGGSILMSNTHDMPTVAAALWQKIIESFIEPDITWWYDSCADEMIAAKVCDPVQSIIIPVKLTFSPKKSEDNGDNNEKLQSSPYDKECEEKVSETAASPKNQEPQTFVVDLCDFVLPAWKNSHAPEKSRFTFMNSLLFPFQMAQGGAILTKNGMSRPNYTFGRKMPMWLRQAKRDAIDL